MWKISEFGQMIGVSVSTLRRWEGEGRLIPERTLGNQRVYTEEHIAIARNIRKDGKQPGKVIIYGRVSSNAQKEDLMRQSEAMEKFCLSQGVSIVHCFSSRLYGLRKYKAKVKKIVGGEDPCSD